MNERLRFDRLSKRARRLAENITKNCHELGQVLALLLDDGLYRHAGHESFVAYVTADFAMSAPVAYRLIDVSRHFSADSARLHGVTKLEAGLAYVRALPVKDRPDDVTAASIRIRDACGRFIGKTFAEATSREVREATARVKSKNRRPEIPAQLRQRVGRVAQTLPPVPRRFVRGDRIRLQQENGRVFASFMAIPLDELDDYIASLHGLKPDAV